MTVRPSLALPRLLLAALLIFCAGQALAAKLPGQSGQGKAAALPDASALSPGGVDAFVAGLSDEQARKVLRERLAAEAAARVRDQDEERGQAVRGPFERAEKALRGLGGQGGALAAQAAREWTDRAALLDAAGGASVLRSALALAGLVLLGGLAAFLAARAGSRRLEGPLLGRLETMALGRLWAMAARAALHAASVLVFAAVSLGLLVSVTQPRGLEYVTTFTAMATCTVLLLWRAASLTLLAPDSALLRPIPLDDAQARTIHAWFMAVATSCFSLALGSFVLRNGLNAQALASLVYASAGAVTGLVLSAMVLCNRREVSLALASGRAEPDEGPLRELAARWWHVPASAYALLMGLAWSLAALADDATIVSLLASLFLIPACIGADLWVRRLLAVASGEDREVIRLDAPATAGEASHGKDLAGGGRAFRDYVPLIRRCVRVALVVFPVFAMLRLWGVDVPLGWLLARNVLSVLLVLVGGLVFWEIVRIRIDRRLSEEAVLPGEEMEEGGGAGGSRSATLLLLLRKFLLCVIVVLGALVALSSLGVDIGPLIAGAGVVGLAIGFGAQTLVKDIISGVFFLVDDAFRVGDYVEAGTAKGTVEQISLRSMKLRHPRGMVFTIPYGGLKILQNYSRDYIISKLDFRVRYDADIEKIRKVIKRINKALMADEDIRKGMLSDIKSMGVRKMEDSAMILRIKFKTVPGHQFLVEKELYRRVQEGFRENGIEFAHRNVTVYLPPEARAGEPLAVAAGAAAAAELAREEDEKRLQAAKAKPKGE
ncbi:Moderate conductance mechanosensitive channel YbiO [Fundidesulfovibrio magnetotacticus]|uniref:Moderate conductance mechanosensitive channel YbiO n=1 Tax=Fundidesulfovibrio magnetotacticus TaxID=2730080 RepID=A0A6V8LXL8_9BACT|nr:mechanosensitive ion channel family protein [Fundidesulfovibrio magnetotacticus]GFK93025.1 Moderate conductance mechanosensitive channel YbiO [Fundidesulfovibrio magnetotacticus]